MGLDKRFKQCNALFISWDDITDVMREIMRDSTYEVDRLEFTYMDAHSLQYNVNYTATDIVSVLSEYLNTEISGYHTNDSGVWLTYAV